MLLTLLLAFNIIFDVIVIELAKKKLARYIIKC